MIKTVLKIYIKIGYLVAIKYILLCHRRKQITSLAFSELRNFDEETT